jgi:pyruvate dehydrogenase E2 component (dihydrolipoamide acetyltransferase)
MPFEFKLPDLGEGIHEAEILAVKISEGQIIKEDQIIFEVETDKAVVEIPSPVSGKILKVSVKNGQIITVGTVMIAIEETGQQQFNKQENTAIEPDKKSEIKDVTTFSTSNPSSIEGPIVASPATRQFARESKVDIHKVTGTGPGGKISKEDVLAYLENLKTPSATITSKIISDSSKMDINTLPDFSKFGKIERIPMRSLRRKTAQLMSLSWSKIPHVTHCDEANITNLEIFRNRLQFQGEAKKRGTKLTPTVFILKAVASALKEFPEFNTSLDEQSQEIIFKHYYNIGMAVATDRGLIVPVIKDVDKKNIFDLAVEIGEAAEKARAAKTALTELQGATFSVTNIGAIGGTSATPIIHYPEAAILAVMKIIQRPVISDTAVINNSFLPLCLAFDHRLADGAQSAQFVRAIIKMLENPISFEAHLGA